MNKFLHILIFLFLFFFQVLVADSIALWGFVTPMLYILFILFLPFQMPKWQVILLGFLMGFCIDIFTGVLGQHAAACVLIAFLRMPIISLIPTHIKAEEHSPPIIWEMHFAWFIQNSLYLTLIHHIFFFFLDTMSFKNFFLVLGIALLNTVATVILIFIFQILFYKPSKRY
jgi:rod shape-determining protein MreD